MRNLIHQILTEELRSTTASRKWSQSLSSSEGSDRRVRRHSPSLSNASNVDKTSQSTCNMGSTEVGDRGPRAKSPVVTESTDIIFSVIQEPEILLRSEPGEKIDDSGDESGDQENYESDNLVQPSLASQLSYVEALVSLRSKVLRQGASFHTISSCHTWKIGRNWQEQLSILPPMQICFCMAFFQH